MRRVWVTVSLLVVSACTTVATDNTLPPSREMVAVAEELCPILWRWQLNIGAVMNDMSYDTRRTDEADDRLDRYMSAFNLALRVNQGLDEEIRLIGSGPFVDLMVQDVIDGVLFGNRIIEELKTTVIDAHRHGEPSYQDIVPVIFLDFEKVIDVAKPELAAYGSPDLIAAFKTVPQCQHGVKDANDGVPRYVPLG
ncbi:MAG TPA: hypothetical protein VIY70_01060 [Acidimicrobiia bacterium]